jgi:hypothetical protein
MKATRKNRRRHSNAVRFLLKQMSARIKAEAHCKNLAYYFILVSGMFDTYTAFQRAYRGKDAHEDCIRYLANLNIDGNPIGKADVEKARVAWEA